MLLNAASSRATPSLVSFGQKARALGEAGATAQTSNFKNTVGSLKRLIGRSLQDADVQEYEKKYLGCELVDVNGEVGAKVSDQWRSISGLAVFGVVLISHHFAGSLRR